MDDAALSEMRFRLANVYWIGGPPDAGKSSVADLLGVWFTVDVYKQDPREREHALRADPDRYPRNAALRRAYEGPSDDRTMYQVWVDQQPAALYADHRANWEERIALVCEDLVAMGRDRTIVAEGPGFFPNAITPLLASPRQAIWLIPTEAFKRASHARRDKSRWRFSTSDPDRALAHHIERDLLFAAAYRREVIAAGLPWIEVNGRENAESIAQRVAAHFGFA